MKIDWFEKIDCQFWIKINIQLNIPEFLSTVSHKFTIFKFMLIQSSEREKIQFFFAQYSICVTSTI
jgi:hypothetical protein